jgi:hypothetical protein
VTRVSFRSRFIRNRVGYAHPVDELPRLKVLDNEARTASVECCGNEAGAVTQMPVHDLPRTMRMEASAFRRTVSIKCLSVLSFAFFTTEVVHYSRAIILIAHTDAGARSPHSKSQS